MRAALIAAGFKVPLPLFALDGGRTNLVFRSGDLVIKVFRPNQANALFGNSAKDEFAALSALKDTDIAPKPLALLDCRAGEILVYRHVDGVPWQDKPERVAKILGQLHRQPWPDLPKNANFACSTAEIGHKLLQKNSDFPPCPQLPSLAPAKPAFIHGDVTANNIIVQDTKLTLIDWQCPRIGDPAEDLAGFLSPAMQLLFGPGLLTNVQTQTFLAAYPDQTTVTRYHALAPLFHWRMAAYCHWQVAQGLKEYQQGLSVELAALANYKSRSHA